MSSRGIADIHAEAEKPLRKLNRLRLISSLCKVLSDES